MGETPGVSLKTSSFAKLFSLLILVSATAAHGSGGPAGDEQSEKDRARLEQLFIWKASEELKLPAEQEQKFTETLHDLSARKKKASEKLDVATRGLAAAKTKADADRAISLYRDSLKEYQAVQTAELDRLKPLLGSEKLARYLVVKSELNEKLKALISGAKIPTSASPAPLATPKIIEEK